MTNFSIFFDFSVYLALNAAIQEQYQRSLGQKKRLF